MSFTMNLNRRHKHLAKRIRCGFTWPCDKDHEHRCATFKGHLNRYHVCTCDAVKRVEPDDRPAN